MFDIGIAFVSSNTAKKEFEEYYLEIYDVISYSVLDNPSRLEVIRNKQGVEVRESYNWNYIKKVEVLGVN